ncbi:hypothetical protein PAPYR_11925 [Paratrimastix pyriformis]|uniref:Uncharacterized protein n=1 Tax=Paratrimastix pyriformis TaxID=342808 RepID=A0ABQ8U579_9EUKA|nr:hypothetical protein PAPYR_11925 [Paratrimastix pyriformis]
MQETRKPGNKRCVAICLLRKGQCRFACCASVHSSWFGIASFQDTQGLTVESPYSTMHQVVHPLVTGGSSGLGTGSPLQNVSETSVRSSQLSSSPGPLDPQHPTGVSLVPFLPGDNIARTRVMLTADPTRKAPMTHGLLNNSSVAQAQDRERPELTRWLFCGQGIHAERGECPTSAMHIGAPAAEGALQYPVQLSAWARDVGKLDGSREEISAPTYTFQSLPIIPAHPIPTSEGHDGAAPSREGEHPFEEKAENSALVRLAHSRVALFHSISAPLPAFAVLSCLSGIIPPHGRELYR